MPTEIKEIVIALVYAFVVCAFVVFSILWAYDTFGEEDAIKVIAPVGFGLVILIFVGAIAYSYLYKGKQTGQDNAQNSPK